MNKRRFNVLHVSDQAKKYVDELNQWSGIDRKTIVDRVFIWLGEQPKELQASILMSFPKTFQNEFAALMLRRLSGKSTPPDKTEILAQDPESI